jgi:hypothetical protein
VQRQNAGDRLRLLGFYKLIMNIQTIIDNLGTPAIVAMLGLVANFVRSMSHNLNEVAISLKLMQQELKLKSENIDQKLDDHEVRLRIVERKK